MLVRTQWFSFSKTNTPRLPLGRDLSVPESLYRNFVLWNKTGSGCVPGSAQEITDLIHFVLKDESLISPTRNKYLSQLFRFLDFKNLNYSDAERIMILFISDEELSRNLEFRDLFFSLIDSFKTNNIPGLLELVRNSKKSSVNQQVLDQCLIRLLNKLTNRDLSEQNPMSFAITVLTEDTEKPEQAYASALYNFISSSFCDGWRMLKRRYFFSNPITRAMYDFFDSAFHFSESQDYKNTEKAEHPISLGSFGVS